MKRSEINQLIGSSIAFFNEMNFKLPPWAYWKPGDWSGKYDSCQEIIDNMHGWDLTDFGGGDFSKRGLILFTLRNGNVKKDKKVYAEKIMIVDEMQETPMHFHWSKMEDIINRGGGNLVIELYQSDNKEDFSPEDFEVKVDGVSRTVKAGDSVILEPGESICLTQGLYHRTDNRFKEPVGRFPDIIEDEEPLHLLAADYQNFI